MSTIVNKTRQPIKVPLPRGKALHLGPGGEGQVHYSALDRPAVKKLIVAGKIEVLDDPSRSVGGDQPSARMDRSTHHHPASRGVSRKGDR
jgi:hypothetical protein